MGISGNERPKAWKIETTPPLDGLLIGAPDVILREDILQWEA
jgi:hypothetical protein